MHLAAAVAFVAVRVFVSCEEHSGYAFPWSPVRLTPWAASVEGHHWHHAEGGGRGMYASQFIFWDALCGTDVAFRARARMESEASRVGKGKSS